MVFVVAFTGVRGVVSLAAALAIPLMIEGGAAFPQRDLVLFATFGVIIVTLVGQGLMLPTVIRWLDPPEDGDASVAPSVRPSSRPATRRSVPRGSTSIGSQPSEGWTKRSSRS